MRAVLKVECLFRFSILCILCFSSDYSVLVLFAVVVLGSVSSVLSHGIGWEVRLRNELFCIRVGRKNPNSNSNSVVGDVVAPCVGWASDLT